MVKEKPEISHEEFPRTTIFILDVHNIEFPRNCNCNQGCTLLFVYFISVVYQCKWHLTDSDVLQGKSR